MYLGMDGEPGCSGAWSHGQRTKHSEKISLSIINPAADKPVHSDLLLFQILFLIKLHREGERQREEERMGRAVKE